MNKKMYAHKINGKFNHFENSLKKLQMSVYGNHPCFEVKVREIKEGEKSSYWGWNDLKDEKYKFIFPTNYEQRCVFRIVSK